MNFKATILKNTRWLSCCLLLFFLFNSKTIKPELLILKALGNEYNAVTENDPNNDAIYEILLKYQWPMWTAKISTFSENEKKEFLESLGAEDEAQFIQKKIFELKDGKDYLIVSVPTVIYELYCLSDAFLFDETKENPTGIGTITKTLVDAPYGKSDSITQTKEDIIKNFIDINENSHTKACFFDINKKVWDYLKQKVSDLTPVKLSTIFTDNKEAKKIIRDLINQVNKLNKNRWKYTESIYSLQPDISHQLYESSEALDLLKNRSTISLIFNILQQEIASQKKHMAVLYRGIKKAKALTAKQKEKDISERSVLNKPLRFTEGTTPNESLITKVQEAHISSTSLSYGNSLFAGILRDPGACAFPSFVYAEHGYTVMIDKKRFAKGELEKLFFISPLITCAALFGRGALFHSRSKIVGNSPDSSLIYGIYQGFYDKSGLIYKQGNTLIHFAKLSKYLSQNTTILSNGWSIVSKQKQSEGEKDQANFFMTLFVAQKFKELLKSKQKKEKTEAPVKQEPEKKEN